MWLVNYREGNSKELSYRLLQAQTQFTLDYRDGRRTSPR